MTDPKPTKRTLRAPPGTRDFYPADLLRRRYIEKAWRDTAIRHGFEEIDGPTFETADLYKVKSGEGILNEMFGVFSGKAEEDLKQLRETGEAPFALRPEFTPTLARMYAARAAQLPKPCKWFWQQNCYRAERQQRGRLREFMQWNCDIIGTENEPEAQARADGEVLATSIDLMVSLGLTTTDLRARVNHRHLLSEWLSKRGVTPERHYQVFETIDAKDKLPRAEFLTSLAAFGLSESQVGLFERGYSSVVFQTDDGSSAEARLYFIGLSSLNKCAGAVGIEPWLEFNPAVARGLAYYTGMVYELTARGERAIAGGGRYDNLIELFGGPTTPAVGFGMGDVVLSLLLTDKGLMPEGKDLLDALSRPAVSFRPDVFVISNDKEESIAAVRPLVARLRRGTESESYLSREARKPWDADRYAAAPLHARHSYKATKNIGKLLQEASACHARFAAIIESAEHATLKNLDTRQEEKDVPLDSLAARIQSGIGPARA